MGAALLRHPGGGARRRAPVRQGPGGIAWRAEGISVQGAAGLVASRDCGRHPGPTGGYRLARAPEKITFLNIVEAVEGEASGFVCTEIRKNNPCRPAGFCDDRPCAIARTMWAADKAWRDSLSGTNLADLGKTLEKDIPAGLRKKTADWIAARS